MPDGVLIAIVTGIFGLLGKLIDILMSRSKQEGAKPKAKRPGDIINPMTAGGILNPVTVVSLVLGVIVGFLVVPVLLSHPSVTPTPTPTLTPTPEPPALQKGALAVTHTTAGDKLLIHDQPGFDAHVVARLVDGTIVTLVDGPLTVNGDHWWMIRMSDGSTGWAVEAVNGVETLKPAQP